MIWNHSRIMSVTENGEAVVVQVDDGWEALPFGMDGGASGVYSSREHAIEMVEAITGDMVCCVGHLAENSDR